jgi:hypothetical protein
MTRAPSFACSIRFERDIVDNPGLGYRKNDADQFSPAPAMGFCIFQLMLRTSRASGDTTDGAV